MLQSRISIHLLVARDKINGILSSNASGEQLSPAALAPLQALLNDMQVVKDLLDKEEEQNLRHAKVQDTRFTPDGWLKRAREL